MSLQRRSTVVTFLLMHPVGTDRLVPHPRFELRLKPQLDTPSPLGRGSNHAPNEPVRTMIVIVSSFLTVLIHEISMTSRDLTFLCHTV